MTATTGGTDYHIQYNASKHKGADDKPALFFRVEATIALTGLYLQWTHNVTVSWIYLQNKSKSF